MMLRANIGGKERSSD